MGDRGVNPFPASRVLSLSGTARANPPQSRKRDSSSPGGAIETMPSPGGAKYAPSVGGGRGVGRVLNGVNEIRKRTHLSHCVTAPSREAPRNTPSPGRGNKRGWGIPIRHTLFYMRNGNRIPHLSHCVTAPPRGGAKRGELPPLKGAAPTIGGGGG